LCISEYHNTGSYKIFISVGADEEGIHEFGLNQLLVVQGAEVLESIQRVYLPKSSLIKGKITQS
jgi:hypothetical protein